MTDETTPPKTFSQQVEAAAAAAGIPEEVASPAATPEPIAAPAEETTVPTHPPADAIKAEPAKAEPKKEPPQTVPLAVHIRQREKHERESSELRRLVAQNEQRMAALMEQMNPPKPPVDRNADPLGATLEEMDSLKAETGQVKELLSNWQQENVRRQQIAAFENAVIDDEKTYTQQVPDYGEAIAWTRRLKYREYQALGLDPQTAAARVQQDAYALAQHALSQGMSPAEMAYRVSTELGWKKEAKPNTVFEKPNTVTAAEDVVAMRAEGGKRQGSPGGGPTPAGNLSYAELAALDNDEFAKMTEGKKWDKLMRGT